MEAQAAYEVAVRPLTAVEISAQVQTIQQVMAAVMVKDVHYGIIPGTQKPTLFKPGSEKILSTFRIAAYPKEIEDLSTYDEIRYRVKVHGISPSGILVGVGIGECSSNEEKYKWRRPVCDEEFAEAPEDRRREVWKKHDGKAYKQKQIRTQAADVANTVLKMAKKRAQIDMTLTATAASDVFDQDLEDLPDGIRQEVAEKKPPLQQPQKKAPAPTAKKEAQSTEGLQNVIVTIESVASKNGETNGKPWTIYSLHASDGKQYKTFSDTYADLGNSAAADGSPVEITYKQEKNGNLIVGMDVVGQREAGQEG